MPAVLLKTLLIMAGIEQNPGPRIWICSVCHQRITNNVTSVKCTACNDWCHLKRCSGLASYRDWSPSFVASCCSSQPGGNSTAPSVTASQTHVLTPTTGHSRAPATQYACSVCHSVIRRNIISVQCNGCNNWCHMRRCTNLRSHRDWSDSFIASCCHNNNPPATVITPHRTAQSPSPRSNVLTPQYTPQLQQPSAQTETPPQLSNTSILNPQTHHLMRPQHSGDNNQSFKIMQLNCNGLRNKVVEITSYMQDNNILIAAIQETKLTRDCRLSSSSNYNIIRRDRERDHGGGLAFIIRRDVNYTLTTLPPSPTPDPFLEVMSISVNTGDTELEFVNVYIPPVNSIGYRYHPSISHLLQGDNRMLLGDFNAHHESWYSQLPNDPRGNLIADQIDESDFAAINECFSTRITARCSSSPDISIVSQSLLAYTTWQALPALSSDHIPIVVTVEKPSDFVEPDKRTFVNYNKANWQGFTNLIDETLRHLPPPTCARRGEKVFRDTILKAARRFIPAGRIPNVRPNFPSNAARLAQQRDLLRASNPADERIEQLTAEISDLVNEHRRSKWLAHLNQCSTSSKKLWSTLKSLSGTKSNNNLAAIAFESTQHTDAKKCATQFCRQFIEHPTMQNRTKRAVIRKSKRLIRDPVPISFIPSEVENTIAKSKPSKALGPDGISMLMLKKLGPVGLEYLTQLLNISIRQLVIPDVWKVARIIPILKPGKPATLGESYRPISLLSPVAKVLESLLLPSLKEHFQLAPHQHGFREAHSTTTALNLITSHITNGLNQQRPCQRTIVAALDLSKAFDTVDHSLLINDISNSTLPNDVKRWIANYLSGRQAFVEFRGQKSKYRKIKMGVPQGGVLSPILFNIYLAKIPTPPQDVSLVSYADDCTIISSGVSIDDTSAKISQYLATINDFFRERMLRLSTPKSTVSLFTSWTKEVRMTLDISVDGRLIPTVQNPKILGVVFDNLLHFSSHATYINQKVRNRNKVLKALAGTSWGMVKETIIATYKAIGRSLLNYAAPVWTSFLSDTQWRGLQTAQNNALRIATGCVKMTSVDHLHEETNMLPVRQHNALLTRQYLVACHQPSHPNHHIVMQDPPPRHIRQDFRRYSSDIQNIIPPDVNRMSLANAQGVLHQMAVSNTIEEYRCNRVLSQHPPAISDDEKRLPRHTRSILAQLRSGWCSILNCYRERIIPGTLNQCPDCLQSPHDSVHLFNCPNRPTNLRPIDLWVKPTEVAQFLQLPMPPPD